MSVNTTMLENASDKTFVGVLPQLMADAKQHRVLVSRLDSSHFETLVSVTESRASLLAQAALGVASATAYGDDVSVLRFNLIRSLATGSLAEGTALDEVAALVALGYHDAALDVARSSPAREDRLRLVAHALAQVSERGGALDPVSVEELKTLTTSVDAAVVGDDIGALAGDVFSVEPSLAVALADRYAQATGRQDAVDSLMATMSLRHARHRRHANASDTALESVRSRIADASLRTAVESASLASVGGDADWILTRTAAIADGSARLAALRTWLRFHSRRPDAAKVTDAALALAVASANYSPTISGLRGFAASLPYADPGFDVEPLVGRFDALLAARPLQAPAIEYVRLQLLLARAQARYSESAATLRTTALQGFIAAQTDMAVRAESLTRLYSWIDRVSPTIDSTALLAQMRAAIGSTISNSADHDEVLRPILAPLTARHGALAFQIVDQVNTDLRRDSLRASLCLELATSADLAPQVTLLVEQLTSLQDPLLARDTLIEVLETLARRPSAGASEAVRRLRASALVLGLREDQATAFAAIRACNVSPEDNAHAVSMIVEALRNIPLPGRRMRAGLSVISTITDADSTAARAVLDELRSSVAPGQGEGAGFLLTLRLAARALQGVMTLDRGTDQDLDDILDACDAEPDAIGRAVLLCELYHGAVRAGRLESLNRIYARIGKTLESASTEGNLVYWRCLEVAGWTMFNQHQRALVDVLESMPARVRELVVGRTAWWILTGRPATEPMEDDDSRHAQSLDYKACTDLLALLERVDDDGLIYRVCCGVVKAITSRTSKLTSEQKATVRLGMSELIAKKLPSKGKIQHDGFKWACAAELLRIDGKTEGDWREVIGYAKAIPNVPDAAYTLALIGSAIPSRFESFRKLVFADANAIAKSVSVSQARVAALRHVAENVWRHDVAVAKALLRDALEVAVSDDGHDSDDLEELLDVAYRISPDFADELGALLDDDDARVVAREKLSRARRAVSARGRLDDEAKRINAGEREQLCKGAWQNLAALNAGALAPKRPDELRGPLDIAAGAFIDETYPIFAWAIQNWVERPGEKAAKLQALRAIFRDCLSVAHLFRVLSRAPGAGLKSQARSASTDSVRIIRPGERELARDFIRDWCVRTGIPYLSIVDQYFGPEELDLVKVALDYNPDCRVRILTSYMHLQRKLPGRSWPDSFGAAWLDVSRESPTSIEVVVANVVPSGKSPVHDRWWITQGSVLDFGTSANSVGVSQESAIKELGAGAAADYEKSVDRFLSRENRSFGGSRVSYQVFEL